MTNFNTVASYFWATYMSVNYGIVSRMKTKINVRLILFIKIKSFEFFMHLIFLLRNNETKLILFEWATKIII